MPTFNVTIQGKSYQVEIPNPGAMPLQIIVDGESFEAHIAGMEMDARPYDGETAQAMAAPPPAPLPMPLPSPARMSVTRVAPPVSGGGSDIVAPMPGTILSIGVSLGQRVEVGEVVCVLEAMKMKNPIRATHHGAVAELAAQAGQTVAYGDLLVRLE